MYDYEDLFLLLHYTNAGDPNKGAKTIGYEGNKQ